MMTAAWGTGDLPRCLAIQANKYWTKADHAITQSMGELQDIAGFLFALYMPPTDSSASFLSSNHASVADCVDRLAFS